MDWVLGNINKLLLILLDVIINCGYVGWGGSFLIRDIYLSIYL